jgi:hypothetical protein
MAQRYRIPDTGNKLTSVTRFLLNVPSHTTSLFFSKPPSQSLLKSTERMAHATSTLFSVAIPLSNQLDTLVAVDVPDNNVDVLKAENVDRTKVKASAIRLRGTEAADRVAMDFAIRPTGSFPNVNESHRAMTNDFARYFNGIVADPPVHLARIYDGVNTTIAHLASLYDAEAYRLFRFVESTGTSLRLPTGKKLAITRWDTFSDKDSFFSLFAILSMHITPDECRKLKTVFGRHSDLEMQAWLEHFKGLRNAVIHRGFVCSWRRIHAIAEYLDCGKRQCLYNVGAFPNRETPESDVLQASKALRRFLSLVVENLLELQQVMCDTRM